MKKPTAPKDEAPTAPRPVDPQYDPNTRTLEGLLAKSMKATTRVALEACRTKPTREKWLAAEKAGWNDVRLDTWDCLWLRQQAVGSLS